MHHQIFLLNGVFFFRVSERPTSEEKSGVDLLSFLNGFSLIHDKVIERHIDESNGDSVSTIASHNYNYIFSGIPLLDRFILDSRINYHDIPLYVDTFLTCVCLVKYRVTGKFGELVILHKYAKFKIAKHCTIALCVWDRYRSSPNLKPKFCRQVINVMYY